MLIEVRVRSGLALCKVQYKCILCDAFLVPQTNHHLEGWCTIFHNWCSMERRSGVYVCVWWVAVYGIPLRPFLSRCERGNSDGVDKEGGENVKILLTYWWALYSPTLTELSYQLHALSWRHYLYSGSKNEMVIIRNASFFQQFLHVLSNLSVLVGHWSQSRQEISIVKHIIIPTGRALWVFKHP